MKTFLTRLLVFCMVCFSTSLLILSGCSKPEVKKEISKIADLNSKEYVIGGETGTRALAVAQKAFPKASFLEFNTPVDIYAALHGKRVDAVVYDRPTLDYATLQRPDFEVLPGELATGRISIATSLENKALLEKVNEFIRNYRADGTYEDMYNRWVKAKDTHLPQIEKATHPTGTIVFGVECANEPMGFIGREGELLGFDIEFLQRLALSLNMEYEVKIMDFRALFPACASGKIDLAVAQIDATPERRETMLFSDQYIDSPISVMVRKSDYIGRSAVEMLNRPECRIGLPQGAASMVAGEKIFRRAKLLYFDSLGAGYTAVQHGKLEAFLFDRHCMEYVTKSNPDLKVLPENIAEEHIVIGFPKRHNELCLKVNEFIRQYRGDGTYTDMYSRWCETANPPPMPEIPVPQNPTVKYRVGTEGLSEPMNFYGKNGDLTGFDIEFIKRLALYLNADLEIVTMNFTGLIAAAESGKIDMLISNLNGTEERREEMLMSDDYVDSAIAIMVHSDRFSDAPVAESAAITSLKDLQGKRAAYLSGGMFQELTEPLMDGINYCSFNDNNSAVQALRTGKVEAVLLDEPVAKLFASHFTEELQIASVYAEDHYGFAFRKGSPLREKTTRVIQELKRTGELAELAAKWCGADLAKKKLTQWTHKKDFSGKNGTLRFATDPVLEPMCYTGPSGECIGLDIEVMNRIAYELDMKLEVIPMNFGGLIGAVNSGKVDAVGGSMSITEERKEKVDFAESHYEGGLTILARKGGTPSVVSGSEIKSFSDLAGRKIGIFSGSIFDTLAKEVLPQATLVYYNMFNDQVVALGNGKIDAFLMDEPQSRVLLRQRPELVRLEEMVFKNDYAFLFSPQAQARCDAFSGEIKRMRDDGTLKKLEDKWFSGDREVQTMPVQSPAPKGTLKFGTVPQLEPFTFVRDGIVVGFDIEVAILAAQKLGYQIEVVPMEINGLIEAVVSEKIDLGGACISVTEERKRKMLFSEPDYHGGVVVIVRGGASSGLSTSDAAGLSAHCISYLKKCASNLAASFERTFTRENRWKLIAQGLKITILITVLSAFLGTILAFPLCMMRRSKHWLWCRIAKGYISLMQGTPILVILMILYYVIFAKIDINAVLVAVIGFGLNFSAYVSEMLRTGIDGIPKGQSEAALALGFSRFAVFCNVIFPQAVRSILPVYRGEFINVLKTTSIVGYIAIQDLTKMSDIIRSRTYEAFFPLIATALIYFAVAWLLASALTFIEYKLDPNSRRKSLRKGGVK